MLLSDYVPNEIQALLSAMQMKLQGIDHQSMEAMLRYVANKLIGTELAHVTCMLSLDCLLTDKHKVSLLDSVCFSLPCPFSRKSS